MIRYLLLFILLTACAQHHKVVSIEPQLQPYFDKFVEEEQSRGLDIKIDDLMMYVSDNIKSTDYGDANYGDSEETPVIKIATKFQIEPYNSDTEQVVFHELGHAVLNRKHRNDTDVVFIPKSIMNSVHVPNYFYETYREQYIDELFGLSDGPQ